MGTPENWLVKPKLKVAKLVKLIVNHRKPTVYSGETTSTRKLQPRWTEKFLT